MRKRLGRISTRSRIALAVASLLLLSVYVFPIWKISLDAPQYPEGLGMYIEVNTIRGASAGNLESINGLNHYIGMKEIRPDSIPELKIMPWLFAALIALGLAAAAGGRRWMLLTWVGLFIVLATTGLVDFYLWEYDYGHNLDQERAIIKVPGMTYQPPLIGSKQMLNITATSLPALGGIMAFVSLAIGLVLSVLELRRGRAVKRGRVAPAAAVLALALGLNACTSEPRPIVYGEDLCQHCKMVIADARFGAEVVTQRHKVLTFDSIECMRTFLQTEDVEVRSLWVTDLANPGTLVPAGTAYFVQSEAIMSPMGGTLAAFAEMTDRDRFLEERGGEALTWSDVMGESPDGGAPQDHGAATAGWRP